MPVQESVNRESYFSSSIVGLFICFKMIRRWTFKTDARISTNNFDFHRQTFFKDVEAPESTEELESNTACFRMICYVDDGRCLIWIKHYQSLKLNTKTKKERMSTILKKTCCSFTSYLLSLLKNLLLSPVCLLIDLFCLLSQLFLLLSLNLIEFSL